MTRKLLPLRQIPSTQHRCQTCWRPIRWARTGQFPHGTSDAYDAEEVLHGADAALRLAPNEYLLARTIGEHDPPPRRPDEYGARLHSKTCPGVKSPDMPEVAGVVLSFSK